MSDLPLDSMEAVGHYVEIQKARNGSLVLPVRLANRESGKYVDVNATVAPRGMSSLITLDYLVELFPEYAGHDAEDFTRADYTWWSPLFSVTLNSVSDAFARATSTCGRLLPAPGSRRVLLSDSVASSMFERSEAKTAVRLRYPISWPYQTPIADIRRNGVLILGTDSSAEGLARMKVIQSELNGHPFSGIVVRDLLDPADMSLEEKVAMFAASASFCVVEATFASGAIAELSLLKALRSTVVVLQEVGRGASFMQADYVLDSPNIRQLRYSMDPASLEPPSLVGALWAGVSWARRRKIEKATWLDKELPWREAQIRLVEIAGGSWRVRFITEFAEHLALGIGRVLSPTGDFEINFVSSGIDGDLSVEVNSGENGATIVAPILQEVFGESSRTSYMVQISDGRVHSVEYVRSPHENNLSDLDDPEKKGLWSFYEVVGEAREPLTLTRVASWFEV